MVKKVFKYLYLGIAWGCTYLVVLCMIAELAGWEAFLQDMYGRFLFHALGAMVTGIGFGTTSIVYSFDRMQPWQKTMIHFLVGMSIFFTVGFKLGWIPYDSVLVIVITILCSTLFFFIIGFIIYFFQKEETKKINERIQEISKENKD